uniref:RNA polymerase-associated protein LEO1 n=1 Tax=Acrobeloides nanus TaxID=290746 RepID=A0A914DY27_9BILA
MSTTSSDDSSASGDSDHDNAAPITSDQNSSDEESEKNDRPESEEPMHVDSAQSPPASPTTPRSTPQSPMEQDNETPQSPNSPKETPKSPQATENRNDSRESTPSSRGSAPRKIISDSEDSDTEMKKSASKPRTWEDDLKSSASEGEKEKGDKKADANALFGGDLSSTDDESKKSDKEEDRELTADDVVGPRLYSEPEEEEEEAPPPIIEVSMSRTRAELKGEPYFVKFPNFLSVETKPFDPEVYEDEIEEEEQLDEEGRSRLKLKLENTIRWRYAKDEIGNEIRESNAKIVKWSDGTMSLYLGNEIFDVSTQRVVDHNHIFVRQGAGLQGQAIFKNKIVFRPISTDTLTHKKMTMTMAEKTNKAQKVKVLADVGLNPEQEKLGLIRKEEEKLRATARREASQRRAREKSRAGGLSSGFLEGYDSDEGDSLAAIKRGYMKGGRHEPELIGAYSDSDQESTGTKRIDEAKIDSDESDYEREPAEKSKQPVKRRIIEEDEDED